MITAKREPGDTSKTAKHNHGNDKAPTIHIKVYSPFKVYFDGEANSISGQNATGAFDILPRHHNFMTLLTPCELLIRVQEGEQRIRISGGLMHVKADQVIVFLDI